MLKNLWFGYVAWVAQVIIFISYHTFISYLSCLDYSFSASNRGQTNPTLTKWFPCIWVDDSCAVSCIDWTNCLLKPASNKYDIASYSLLWSDCWTTKKPPIHPLIFRTTHVSVWVDSTVASLKCYSWVDFIQFICIQFPYSNIYYQFWGI